MIDFVGRRFIYLAISGLMLVISIVAIATGGIRWGIEFDSGSTLTLVFTRPVSQSDLRAELTALGFADATVQDTSRDGYTLAGGNLDAAKAATLDQALRDKFGPTAVFSFTEDQSGKTLYTAVFSHQVSQSDFDALVEGVGVTGADEKTASQAAFLLRTRTISQAPGTDASGKPTPSDLDKLQTALKDRFGDFGMFDFYVVSAAVANDVKSKALIAVVAASVAILLYITFAFRKMPSPLRWGTCAVIALIHDTLFVVGTFAVLGLTIHTEVDAMFISGLLTVVGYSVHDTIVVFDRIRENIRLGVSKEFMTTVDYSLNQTLGRSLSTSLTVVFVLLALFLMGGVTIRNFVLTMLVGVIVGTYSSIFVASQLLVVWDNKEWRKLVSWIPFLRPSAN